MYLGERKSDKKRFALKLMDKRRIDNERSYKYTVNEIDLMRDFEHPNINKIHEVFEIENHIILVLELMDGGNLGTRIK